MQQETSPNGEVIGIHLRSRSLKAVRVSQSGKVSGRTDSPFDSEDESIPQIVRFIEKIKNEIGDFDEFGLALPGLVDIFKNKVVYSAQLPEHERTDLAGQIAAATGKKVFLENDANAAAFGEFSVGAASEAKDFFYVMTGSGIGGALVLDRKVWHGVSGFAGEFGYFALNSEGKRLEDVASAEGIVRRTKNRLHQDPASSLFLIGEENINYEDVLKAAKQQDGLAELIIERTGMFIGTAVAGVINLLNIEKVIVGGPLMETGNLLLDAIKKRASEFTFEPAFRAVQIEAGSLGDDAGPVGAALLVMNRTPPELIN